MEYSLFVSLHCNKKTNNKRQIKMKAIKAKDIKVMIKKFDLNEEESYYLNDIAAEINKERTEICEDIQMTLLYGSYSIKSKRNAISALLVYFGAKLQKENKEIYGELDRTCWEIAKTLKSGYYQVMQWFKGIACTKDRFGKFVKCSDTYGLNYLEIV